MQRLEERIGEALSKIGRKREEITLVAVTKGRDVEEIRNVIDLGIRDIGENRVQEAKFKYQKLRDLPIVWHLVGHLQTNKVKLALEIFDYIHSLDSLKLAHAIERRAEKMDKTVKVFLQVNISAEATKFGISPQQAFSLVSELLNLNHLKLIGLMTIAPLVSDAEEVRPYFKQLRILRDELSAKFGLPLFLSMGMTQDFEIALEEGADFLRIGRAIFEG